MCSYVARNEMLNRFQSGTIKTYFTKVFSDPFVPSLWNPVKKTAFSAEFRNECYITLKEPYSSKIIKEIGIIIKDLLF